MYQVENSGDVLRQKDSILRSFRRYAGSTVFFLGLTSLFTDISSEMVSTTLPLYLVFTLRFSPLQFGIIDGLYQGASIIVRLISGVITDRIGKPKEIAAIGYILSAVNKVGMLFGSVSWNALTGFILLDRLGKGIRTPPRDLLISQVSSDKVATAFGVHRALDTFGAMTGPIIASILLFAFPGSYKIVFAVSMGFAFIGVFIIAFFVHSKSNDSGFSSSLTSFDISKLFKIPGFVLILIASSVLSLVTISDSFIYLTLQKQVNVPQHWFPFFYVIVALVFMLTAVPIGRLADKKGKKQVFLAGYLILGLAYLTILFFTSSLATLFSVLILLGLYYAATDGVLAAITSQVVPGNLKATSLALVATGSGLMKIISSVGYGWIWESYGSLFATVTFTGLFFSCFFGILFLFRGLKS